MGEANFYYFTCLNFKIPWHKKVPPRRPWKPCCRRASACPKALRLLEATILATGSGLSQTVGVLSKIRISSHQFRVGRGRDQQDVRQESAAVGTQRRRKRSQPEPFWTRKNQLYHLPRVHLQSHFVWDA